ncbi:MAG: 50S ribosomal protein L25 [Candidatus Dormibacteria bacterium]|jgi:large subunit ribosomal protein L25
MADLTLDAHARSETGRHVHHLRRRGEVPAILYGYDLSPLSISADSRALLRIWERAGRSQLVHLAVDGAAPRTVLIRDFQIDPRTARPLHADFFAINLNAMLTVDVPLVMVGDAPAVTTLKLGLLQQLATTLAVECLPSDLPAQLDVDVSGLVEVDQGLHVRDVALPKGVRLGAHVDVDEMIAKIAPLRVVVEEEVAAPAEAAAPTAATDATGKTETPPEA